MTISVHSISEIIILIYLYRQKRAAKTANAYKFVPGQP